MHFRSTYESLPWLRCKSGAKEHSSHLSHNNKRNTDIEQKNWKPCWVRFPGSEKLGASRNGRMERNFPVIPIFRNFRPTSWGTPKISEWNSGKCLFHSLPNPEFPEFLVEWKAPLVTIETYAICQSFRSIALIWAEFVDMTLFGVPQCFFIAHLGHFSILRLQCQGYFKPNINSLFISSIFKGFIAKHIA